MRHGPNAVGKRTLLAKSCLTCGHFKQASEYRITNKGYWQSECKNCQHGSAKVADKKAINRSRPRAKKHHDIWTDSELRQLAAMRRIKMPIEIIAKELKRSIPAINNVVHKNGL